MGQKAIAIMPEVMRDVQGMLVSRIQQRTPAMLKKLRARSHPAAAPPSATPSR